MQVPAGNILSDKHEWEKKNTQAGRPVKSTVYECDGKYCPVDIRSELHLAHTKNISKSHLLL